MPVNVGGLGSNISFQDLQDFYGGTHPISLSEYYRGGTAVPSTAISGNNPYTGMTSFMSSPNQSGNGGEHNINVGITNRDFTSTLVAANSGVSGTVTDTIPGPTSTVDSSFISGNIPSGTGFTFVNFPAPGARITSATSTAASNTNRLSFYSGESSPSGSTGTALFQSTQPRATFSGSQAGVRSIVIQAQNQDGDPRGHAGGTYRGFQQITQTGTPTYNVRYTNTTSHTINSIQTNHGTFNLGPGASRDFNGVSSNNVSVRNHPAVTQNNPRRTFTFTNNTGQVINLTATGNGSSQTVNELARGGMITRADVTGDSEAWSFNYDITQAGGGSGTGDETNGGVFTDVTTIPGGTSFGSLGRSAFRSALPYSIVSTDAIIEFAATHPSGASDEPVSATFQIRRGSSVVGGPFSISNGGNGPVSGFLRGPAYRSGDESSFQSRNRSSTTLWRVGDRIEVTRQQGNVRIDTQRRSVTTNPTTYNLSFRNDNPDAIILDPASTIGGGQTLAANTAPLAERTVTDTGRSSPNWSFNYRYAPSSQPANTAIPTDTDPATPGPEIGLDQFNAPGNAAP